MRNEIYQAPPFNSYETFKDSLPEIIDNKLDELSKEIRFHAQSIRSKERMLKDPIYWCGILYRFSPNCLWFAKAMVEELELKDHREKLVYFLKQKKKFDWLDFRTSNKEFTPGMTIADFKELNPLLPTIKSYQKVFLGNKILCPFHKETLPSCQIYKDNHGYCFGCNMSFDVLNYLQQMTGLPISKIIKK